MTRQGPRRAKRELDGRKWGEGWIKERVRADGSVAYQARWTDDGCGDGQIERAKTFATLDAAEDFLRDQIRAKRDGRYAPPSTVTVRRLIDDWLARGEHRWKPSTVYAYRVRADQYVLPKLGDATIASLTTPRLQHWVDGLSRDGLAATTVHAAVIVLQSALREAVAIGLLERSPAQGLRRPAIRRAPTPTWTDEEMERVIAVVADDPMWHAIYRVALATGMRPGELRALTWSDVRPDEGVIRVRRTVSRDRDGHDRIGATTKTGRERAVAVGPLAMAALLAWRTAQKARRIARANVWRDLDLVFDRGNGDLLPKTAWSEKHDAICAAAGVRRVTLHGTRHANATSDLEAGVHPKIVSERLGHASITTTLDIYSHVSVDLQRAAAEALERRMAKDDGGGSKTRLV